MSKQLQPHELAELVTTLLTNPRAIGELDTESQHIDFFRDIGEVVAQYCGGEVNGVGKADDLQNYLSNTNTSQPMLSVSPSDSLPSLERNVWAYHDPEGWIGEEPPELDAGEPMTEFERSSARSKMQVALVAISHKSSVRPHRVEYEVADTTVAPQRDVDGVLRGSHILNCEFGNHAEINLRDKHLANSLNLKLEVSAGLPTLTVGSANEPSNFQIVAKNGELHISSERQP